MWYFKASEKIKPLNNQRISYVYTNVVVITLQNSYRGWGTVPDIAYPDVHQRGMFREELKLITKT